MSVTGKVEGQNWYRIDRDGEVAYVYASLLEEPRDEPAAPPQELAPAEPTPSDPNEALPRLLKALTAAGLKAGLYSVPPASASNQLPAPAPGPTPQPDSSESLSEDAEPAIALLPARPAPAMSGAGWRPQAEELAGRIGASPYIAANVHVCHDPDRRSSVNLASIRWRDISPEQSRISFGGKMAELARKSSTSQLNIDLAVFIANDYTVLIDNKSLTTASIWCRSHNSDLTWVYFAEKPLTIVEAKSPVAVDWFQFQYHIFRVQEGSDTRECIGFQGVRSRHRLDGFVCRQPGVSISRADAEQLLRSISIPGVIGS